VVSHFLTDYIRNGSFTGFPALGVQWQRMESDALRRAYSMQPKQKGAYAQALVLLQRRASLLPQALGRALKFCSHPPPSSTFLCARSHGPRPALPSEPSRRPRKTTSPRARPAPKFDSRVRLCFFAPGVLIRRVNATSHAASVLQSDDVLLSFDGTAIANDGTVPFRTGERIAFSYLISQKYVGDEAALEVLRGGEVLSTTAK
jgi:hypothetical protein